MWGFLPMSRRPKAAGLAEEEKRIARRVAGKLGGQESDLSGGTVPQQPLNPFAQSIVHSPCGLRAFISHAIALSRKSRLSSVSRISASSASRAFSMPSIVW